MNEKEAIQILKNMNIEISGTSTCKECIYDDETHCFRDGKDCQMQAIETVLNLLEKKDKEIQFQKEINKTEQNRHKQTEKSLKGQLHKKDKIIDEMATYIATLDIEEDICEKTKNEHCDKMNFGECEDCIKQYFERKVENGN